MNLRDLRYLVALADLRHFGRAAEASFVSQPTLSVGVKKLEDELGVMIFERSKSAVRLTPVGETIVAQAQRVLEQAQGIRELAQAVMDVVGFSGRIVFDATKPDGTPRKLLDVSRLGELGWSASTGLREGIALAHRDFLNGSR